MAVIDFPAAPAVGEIFNASTGAVYQWNGTVWVPVGVGGALIHVGDTPPSSPGSGQQWFNSALGQLFVWYDDGSSAQWVPTNPVPMVAASGDFCAIQTSSFPPIPASLTTLILTQLLSGNSGGWYSTSTGRYTPPAGRYSISAGYSAWFSAFANAQIFLRKNGVSIANGSGGSNVASEQANARVSAVVDASGSDWFDIQGNADVASVGVSSMFFQSYPISGIKGPPGDRGITGDPGTPGAPGPPGSVPTGDFCANQNPYTIPGGAYGTLIPTTITSGNSGGWYSTSTGRYTPPAGRYFISAQYSATYGPGAVQAYIQLRKNGVVILIGHDTTAAGNYWANPVIEQIVDANGTDWFDVQGHMSSSGAADSLYFLAFPISGVKGPQGDPPTAGGGIIREVTLAAPATTIDLFNLGVKSCMVMFKLEPIASNTNIYFQVAVGSVVNSTTNYYFQQMYTTGSSVNGGFTGPFSSINISSADPAHGAMVGTLHIPDIGINKYLAEVTTGPGGSNYRFSQSFYVPLGSNGFRFSTAGTFAAGSFVRVIGWP